MNEEEETMENGMNTKSRWVIVGWVLLAAVVVAAVWYAVSCAMPMRRKRRWSDRAVENIKTRAEHAFSGRRVKLPYMSN